MCYLLVNIIFLVILVTTQQIQVHWQEDGSLSVSDPLIGLEHQEHSAHTKCSFHFYWTDSFTALHTLLTNCLALKIHAIMEGNEQPITMQKTAATLETERVSAVYPDWMAGSLACNTLYVRLL